MPSKITQTFLFGGGLLLGAVSLQGCGCDTGTIGKCGTDAATAIGGAGTDKTKMCKAIEDYTSCVSDCCSDETWGPTITATVTGYKTAYEKEPYSCTIKEC